MSCCTAAAAEPQNEAGRLAENWEAVCLSKRCGAALHNFGLLRLAQGMSAPAEKLFRAGVDALREQSKEWSPLLPWHPDTLEAMSGVAAAIEKQEKRLAEAEEGLRGLLALHIRFIGVDHPDSHAIRKRLAEVLSLRQRRIKDEGKESAETGPVTHQQVADISPPPTCSTGIGVLDTDTISVIASSGFSLPCQARPTVWGLLGQLWQDLPGLGRLHELQLREMHGLDWGECDLFALNVLRASNLRSADVR